MKKLKLLICPHQGLDAVFPEDSLGTALVDHIVTGVHIVEASDSLDNLSFLHKVFLNIIKYKDCSVLRTLTILPGIRISRSVHPAFMLIPGRVPRSYIRFCASTSVYMTLVHYLKGTLL